MISSINQARKLRNASLRWSAHEVPHVRKENEVGIWEVPCVGSFFTSHSLVLASTSASKRRGTPAKKAVERKKTTEETTPSAELATANHEDNHPGETNRAESIVCRCCMDHSLSPFVLSSSGWTSLNHRYKTSRTNGRRISRTADTRGKCHSMNQWDHSFTQSV